MVRLHLATGHATAHPEGMQAAGPGEFTNVLLEWKDGFESGGGRGRLIASSSAATHRMAMNQMRGGFSRELSALRERLLHLTSLMELELDFSDMRNWSLRPQRIGDHCRDIEKVISGLVHSFSVGNVLKNGIPVAIVGETNAGKSTLLNTLLNEEKAIVSDIHGTTRDVIEDTVNLSGITFRFIDTAGIRDTHDTIENMGIARSFHKMEQAEIVLWVVDNTCAEAQIRQLSPRILPLCSNKQLIILLNKSDQVSAVPTKLSGLPENTVTLSISAKEKTGIQELQISL